MTQIDINKRETKTKKRHQEVAVEKILASEMNCKLELDPGSQESNKISLSLETIIALAMHGSDFHEKRQSDVYRAIKTLVELTEKLKKRWIQDK